MAFLLATAGPIAFTRYGGGVACLWLATAVLGTYLSRLPLRRWPLVMVLAALLNAVITGTLGIGPWAAVPMGIIGAIESALLGLCLRMSNADGETTLASHKQVVTLLAAATGVSVISAFPGAWVAAWASDTPYWEDWFNWAAGHMLGTITLAPIMLLLLRGDAAQWLRDANHAERIEAGFLGIVICATAITAFSQHAAPLLYLPILPVMTATVRVGRIGAALSIGVVALIATIQTLRGEGPIAMIDATPAFRIQFLQFYLAVVVLTVLPAAADLRRRKEILDRLAISETRYRLVSENTTDVVISIDSDGLIRHISSSAVGLGAGYEAEYLTGTDAIELIIPEDRAHVETAYQEATSSPGVTRIVEYRGTAPDGSNEKWFESRFRTVETQQGVETVCAIRDISARKAAEAELMLAASTDPLTGLNNRRIFNDALDSIIDAASIQGKTAACVAIFDIDHFKAINDGFGHDAGDRMLQRFAEVAMRVTRAHDLVARMGGEEFAVLLPDTTPAQAEIVCNRLRMEFARSEVEEEGGAVIRATVSAGIACVTADEDRETSMRAADGALYEAKRSGRNRLVLAD